MALEDTQGMEAMVAQSGLELEVAAVWVFWVRDQMVLAALLYRVAPVVRVLAVLAAVVAALEVFKAAVRALAAAAVRVAVQAVQVHQTPEMVELAVYTEAEQALQEQIAATPALDKRAVLAQFASFGQAALAAFHQLALRTNDN